MRYGIHGKLIDFGVKKEIPMNFLALEMLEFVDDVVDGLGSREEVNHIRTILERGTSADRQVAAYQKALDEGASEEEALIAVVDFLTDETMRGL